ncbi:uncharacterized protein [Rutidosis leptorrhynchoides]|uniref:uncharacterized protein n=1 Tax=Rutidosis leptorrhynchoides TaxID=125765 RepID=UPI003A99EC53
MEQKFENLNYSEGCFMQRPPLLESEGFCYWKQRFETYVCAKDIDFWNIITKGNYVPTTLNDDRKTRTIVPEENWSKEHKECVSKNYQAKLVLFNALPRKEYERVFMLDTAKEIWDSIIITHQGNSQVIENKTELLIAQYEQFAILDNEKIDSAYARFNNTCSSLKALGTMYTNKQYVRKFLRALPSKWRPKVTAIDESKDLEKLTLDELMGNLKVHEVILEKDEEADKIKKEKFKSIALKAKANEECEYDDDDDDILNDSEQLAFIVRSFKKFYRRPGNNVRAPMDSRKAPFEPKKKFVRKCFGSGDPNHLISECPKRKNEKAFLGGAWDDEEEETQDEEKEACLMAIESLNSEDNKETCLVGQTKSEVSPNLLNLT